MKTHPRDRRLRVHRLAFRAAPAAAPDDVEVVNLDALTYAGNPANLADVADDERYRFVHGSICDADAVASAAEGCDAIVNFAAETHVDRSIMEAGDFIQTDVFGTLPPARVDPRARRPPRARLDRRGLRRHRGRLRLARGRRAAAELAVLGLEGRRRPAGARSGAHLRRRRRDHARLEQLRAQPVSREADPAVHDEPARRRARARLRRRPPVARLHLRRGSLRRHRDGARARRERRDLQRRRRQRDREPDHDDAACSSSRAATRATSATSPTARATTAATRSTRASCRGSAGGPR